MMECLGDYNKQMIHDHIIKLFVRKSLSSHLKLIVIYGTFSISLLDQRTIQSVIRPRGDSQTGLSGRWHPISQHQLDCEWSSHLRWAAAPTATCSSVFGSYWWSKCFVDVFVFSATAVEPRRSLTASGSLILKDVSFGDTAIYQCRASNKHGTILTNTNVYVIGEYLLPVCSLVDRKCAVVSYFSFLLHFRTVSSDPHWGWKYIHLCWRPEGCDGVWNLWLP